MPSFSGILNSLGFGRPTGFAKPTEAAPKKPEVGEQEPQGGAWPNQYDPWEFVGFGRGECHGYGRRPPGTYANYFSMLCDPVLAMARAYALNPIRLAKWTVAHKKEGVPDQWVDFVRDNLLCLRDLYVEDGLWAVDMGWAGYQIVWEVANGRYVPQKLQPCEQETSTILVGDNREVAGVNWQGVELLGQKAFVYTYDRRGKYWYGRSRLENIIEAIANWRDANNDSAGLRKKRVGTVAKIGYPPGQGKDSSGNPVSRKAQAKAFGQTLMFGAGYVTYPTLGGYTDEQLRAMPVDSAIKLINASLWKIETLDLGSTGPEIDAVTRDKAYLDQLKCLGYFVPPRSIMEGEHGTKAEAGVHQSAATVANEPVNVGLVQAFNRGVVNPALTINFGDKAKDAVWFEAESLEDAQPAFDRQLILGLLQGNLATWVVQEFDIDPVFDRNGVQKRQTPIVIAPPVAPGQAAPPAPGAEEDAGATPPEKPGTNGNGSGKKPVGVAGRFAKVNGDGN